MDNLKTYLAPLGRLLMSSIFIWAGIGKLTAHDNYTGYFASAHIPMPNVSVWIVGVFELVFGLAILVGFKTRWAAILLALFCLVTGFGVHLVSAMHSEGMAQVGQMVNFYKNLVMAGGFLYLVAYGAGGLSVDGEKA